jgi:hypothetical protein
VSILKNPHPHHQERTINMHEARRQAVRVISHLLDSLVKELTDLADAETAAFESRPPGSQQSPSGDNSIDAQDQLNDAADKISDAPAELSRLCEPHS